MNRLFMVLICICGAALAQDITLDPGQDLLIECAVQDSTECPDPGEVLEPTLHEVHYARHKTEVKRRGKGVCKSCHGNNLRGTDRSMAHGVRVFLTDEKFSGATRCYTSPYRAPNAPPVDDPYGRYEFPDSVCSPAGTWTKYVAVFNEGDYIGCNNCHDDDDDDSDSDDD